MYELTRSTSSESITLLGFSRWTGPAERTKVAPDGVNLEGSNIPRLQKVLNMRKDVRISHFDICALRSFVSLWVSSGLEVSLNPGHTAEHCPELTLTSAYNERHATSRHGHSKSQHNILDIGDTLTLAENPLRNTDALDYKRCARSIIISSPMRG